MSEDISPLEASQREPIPSIRELPGDIDNLVHERNSLFATRNRGQLSANERINVDEKLTGLPIYQPTMRKLAMYEYRNRIADPQSGASMVVYADLDQLKRVNDLDSKEAGNAYIKWGAASLANGLNNVLIASVRGGDVTGDPQMITVRATGAADETIIWIYGLDSQTEQDVKDYLNTYAAGKDVMINTPSGPQAFHCDSSIGYVSTSDEWYRENIEQSVNQLPLLDADGNLVHDGFSFQEAVERMEQRCDDMAKETKVVKELERLPIEQFFEPNHIDEFINALKTDFGGGRISEHMLEILLKMQSLKTVIDVAPEKYEYALEQMGVSRETIEQQIREASSAHEKIGKMVDIFRSIFGSSEESA